MADAGRSTGTAARGCTACVATVLDAPASSSAPWVGSVNGAPGNPEHTLWQHLHSAASPELAQAAFKP